jgi:hypothetical protein
VDAERRREQMRQAQVRYRKVHAERLRTAGRIANMLVRQKACAGDAKELAAAIRGLVGPEYAHALGRELMRRKRKARL